MTLSPDLEELSIEGWGRMGRKWKVSTKGMRLYMLKLTCRI